VRSEKRVERVKKEAHSLLQIKSVGSLFKTMSSNIKANSPKKFLKRKTKLQLLNSWGLGPVVALGCLVTRKTVV